MREARRILDDHLPRWQLLITDWNIDGGTFRRLEQCIDRLERETLGNDESLGDTLPLLLPLLHQRLQDLPLRTVDLDHLGRGSSGVGDRVVGSRYVLSGHSLLLRTDVV